MKNYFNYVTSGLTLFVLLILFSCNQQSEMKKKVEILIQERDELLKELEELNSYEYQHSEFSEMYKNSNDWLLNDAGKMGTFEITPMYIKTEFEEPSESLH